MDPNHAAGFANFIAQTDGVGKTILTILLMMSFATWYLIVTKAVALVIERRKSARFLEAFSRKCISAVTRGPPTKTLPCCWPMRPKPA